jgi:hypothetical protein
MILASDPPKELRAVAKAWCRLMARS